MVAAVSRLSLDGAVASRSPWCPPSPLVWQRAQGLAAPVSSQSLCCGSAYIRGIFPRSVSIKSGKMKDTAKGRSSAPACELTILMSRSPRAHPSSTSALPAMQGACCSPIPSWPPRSSTSLPWASSPLCPAGSGARPQTNRPSSPLPGRGDLLGASLGKPSGSSFLLLLPRALAWQDSGQLRGKPVGGAGVPMTTDLGQKKRGKDERPP